MCKVSYSRTQHPANINIRGKLWSIWSLIKHNVWESRVLMMTVILYEKWSVVIYIQSMCSFISNQCVLISWELCIWWCLLLLSGIGGTGEAVALAEVSRYTTEQERTGIISKLIAIRQIALVAGGFLMNSWLDSKNANCVNKEVSILEIIILILKKWL